MNHIENLRVNELVLNKQCVAERFYNMTIFRQHDASLFMHLIEYLVDSVSCPTQYQAPLPAVFVAP